MPAQLPFNRVFLEYRIPNRKLAIDDLLLLHAAISCRGCPSVNVFPISGTDKDFWLLVLIKAVLFSIHFC